MKRTTILTVLILHSFLCFSQPQKLFFRQIGLFLELPAEFKIINRQENDQETQMGLNIIEEETNIPLDIQDLTTLFAASKDPFSYVSATITKFDSTDTVPYSETNQKVKDVIYSIFTNKITARKIDSATSTIIIDSMLFEKFDIIIELDSNVYVNAILISRLHKGYNLGISLVYVNEKTKQQMDSIVESIRFKSE
jgi:hypothetical protein